MDFFFQPLLLQKSISPSFQRENFAVNPRRTIKGVDLRLSQEGSYRDQLKRATDLFPLKNGQRSGSELLIEIKYIIRSFRLFRLAVPP